MKNWLTSIGGVMIAVGMLLARTDDPLVKSTGVALEAVGAVMLGFAAKDFNTTGVGKNAKTGSELDN